MSAIQAPASPPMHPIIDCAYNYWNGLRRDRSMPSRADINPAAIKDVLPHIVLNDVLPGETAGYRYRLVGTKVVDYYGLNPTGKRLDEVATGVFYEEVVATFARIRASRQPEFEHLEKIFPYLTRYQRLILPLSNDDRHVNMIWVNIVGPVDLRQVGSMEPLFRGDS